MNILRCVTGMEHFFNDDDGTYDGWGMAIIGPPGEGIADGLLDMNIAEQLVQAIEQDREFPTLPPDGHDDRDNLDSPTDPGLT